MPRRCGPVLVVPRLCEAAPATRTLTSCQRLSVLLELPGRMYDSQSAKHPRSEPNARGGRASLHAASRRMHSSASASDSSNRPSRRNDATSHRTHCPARDALGSVPVAHGGGSTVRLDQPAGALLSVRTGGAAHKERPVRLVKLQRGGEQLDRTLPRASAHGRICLLQARAVAACAADGMFGLQLVLRACLRTLARLAAAALLRAACKGGAPDAQCRRTPAVPIRPRQRNSSSLLFK